MLAGLRARILHLIDLLQSCCPLRHDGDSEDWRGDHVSLEGLQGPGVHLLCHAVMHLFQQKPFESSHLMHDNLPLVCCLAASITWGTMHY